MRAVTVARLALMPLASVLVGRVFLGERLRFNAWAGAVLVVAGIAMARSGALGRLPPLVRTELV